MGEKDGLVLLTASFITDNDFISPSARNSRTSGKTASDSIKRLTPPSLVAGFSISGRRGKAVLGGEGVEEDGGGGGEY